MEHVFEIIEECSTPYLNVRERYYQDMYDVLGKNGLNCILVRTDQKPRIFSKETIERIRFKNSGLTHPQFGKKLSEATKNKISLSAKNQPHRSIGMLGHLNPMFGKDVSNETRQKISNSLSRENNPMYGRKGNLSPLFGRKLSEEHKAKISEAHRGKVLSEETKIKLSNSKKGVIVSEETRIKLREIRRGKRLKGENPSARKVIDVLTGHIFDCVEDASDSIGVSIHTLYAKLGNSTRKNNTNLIYL